MNLARTTRLLWVAVSDGFLTAAAVVAVVRGSHDIALVLFGTTVCAVCVAGFTLEALKHPIAGVFNIGMPMTLTVLMLTATFWLPKIGESSEAAEGFGPAVPPLLLLTAVTALMYGFVRPTNSGSQT